MLNYLTLKCNLFIIIIIIYKQFIDLYILEGDAKKRIFIAGFKMETRVVRKMYNLGSVPDRYYTRRVFRSS